MNRLVIIGNGVAAAGCVEGIRSLDSASEIVILSEEKWPVYCRPLISYYLEGKTKFENMGYRDSSFYDKNKCRVLYERVVNRLDTRKKTILLDDGSVLGYDSLCVSTGATPFVPKIDGLDRVKKAYCFRTLNDALALEKNVDKSSRVLILGAGFVGLKCAEGLLDRAGSITVCNRSPQILSSVLDKEASVIMQKNLENHGIIFHLGEQVRDFSESSVRMQSGLRLDFDVLVLALGLTPNISLVKDCGGDCGKGIRVDDHMRTSIRGIYAAGDCVESLDVSSGTIKMMSLMPSAYCQGYCAGVNMSGGDKRIDNEIPLNAVGFWGLHGVTGGIHFDTPEANEEIVVDKSDNSFKKLFIRDGRLVGFILLGNVERAGIYTSLITSQRPLETIDFEHMKKNPSLASLGYQCRQRVLGRLV